MRIYGPSLLSKYLREPSPVDGLATFPLDADLTDLILTTIPNIRTLQSFVLCSKFIYNVFDSRRTSVLRAVVSNHLGPATLPAIRLLKILVNINGWWRSWISPYPVERLPIEEDFRLDNPRLELTMREAKMLAANHDIVREFEGLYSWR